MLSDLISAARGLRGGCTSPAACKNWGWLTGTLLITVVVSACTPAASLTLQPDSSSPNPASEAVALPPDVLAQTPGQMLPITAEAELAGHLISLEVARTREQQTLGLMHRTSLPDDRGMVFPFDPPRPVRFWMKNVVIPLDMVFVYRGTVVAIASEVPPCTQAPCPTYGPEQQLVDHVIELRGGLATALELEVGDRVDIRWLTQPEDLGRG